MIRIQNLNASCGSFRLRDVHLEVGAGECCVILGPSGAGKTMLLEAILGLKKPEAGRVIVEGVDITDLAPEDRHVAYIPQDVALFPHLSVRDNILFGRRMRKTLRHSDHDLARLASMLDIQHLLERHSVRTLSGGERQRVALARALITHPKVLFLDESFAALDNHIRRQILAEFRQLQQTLGVTVIAVTHSHEQASILADKLIVVVAGRIVQTGCVEEVFTRPANRATAQLLALRNVYPVGELHPNGHRTHCRIGDVSVIATAVPETTNENLYLWLPPEDIILRTGDRYDREHAAANRYHAQVHRVFREGLQRYVHLNLGNGQGPYIDSPLPPHAGRHDPIVPGDTVEVLIPYDAVTLFPEK